MVSRRQCGPLRTARTCLLRSRTGDRRDPATTLLGHPYSCEPSGVDLLVAPAWMPALDEVLVVAGFERARTAGDVGATPYTVVYARARQNGEPVTLEIHPAWHEVTLSEDGDRTLVGAASGAVARAQIARAEWGVLASAVELYLTAAHVVLHNPRTLSVYLDLAILLDRADADVLERAAAFARENGRERRLRHALTMAADLFGLELGREFLNFPRRIVVPTAVRLGY
ncbi:MAG: nucleotidyltransferase family protein [Gemmatimonadota bacterium]